MNICFSRGIRRVLLASCLLPLTGRIEAAEAPREVLSLNGRWQCEPGPADAPPRAWTHAVPVPGLVDLSEPPLAWADHPYIWYRTTFRLPAGAKRSRALLRIEQSQFGSEVWLNRRLLGRYNGCYTAHEYEAGDVLVWEDENELLVRVGRKDTLPADSAVGMDSEKRSYCPGIWGDVMLIRMGDPAIRSVLVTPHLSPAVAEYRVEIENRGAARSFTVAMAAREKESAAPASPVLTRRVEIPPGTRQLVRGAVPIERLRPWSPDDPFLYEADVSVLDGMHTSDQVRCTFGMREFEIRGSDFYLNGQRIFLRGGNIAFHRFLSDPAHGTLPWDEDWIKRVLVDLPKESHFNYFRIHLGHAYRSWYDLADAHGMCLQDEWMFWGRLRASRTQVRAEFTAWLRDNYNHPSIIIWDPLNEPEENASAQAFVRMIQRDIVPGLKAYDPTRPWASVDFEEDHPYIYSLGPVLNDSRFGFARSIHDIEHSDTPGMVNEFMWFWLDEKGDSTWGTRDIALRWLGRDGPREDLLDFQSFLAGELVEQFRRMQVDAIAPFVYLGDGQAFTANWFLGDLRDLRPKPILAALANAYAPLGVSLDVWDRHFFTGERRLIRACIFNDRPAATNGLLRCRMLRDGMAMNERVFPLQLAASSLTSHEVPWTFPEEPGTYTLQAALETAPGEPPCAVSEKVAHVFRPPSAPATLRHVRFAVQDSDPELLAFLIRAGLAAQRLDSTRLEEVDVLVMAGAQPVRGQALGPWLAGGGSLVVIDPSRNVRDATRVPLTADLSLRISPREPNGRGGYDSHVFPVREDDPLWTGMQPEHLRLLNGGLGGVMVPDWDVVPDLPCFTRARSGLALRNSVVMQGAYGRGKFTLSLLQLGGRLVARPERNGAAGLRPDPVAQQFLLNLLADAARPGLPPEDRFRGVISASSGTNGPCAAVYAIDGDGGTRWGSDASDPQWLVRDLGRPTALTGVRIRWEAAYGREYKVLVSDDTTRWTTVHHERKGDGGEDVVTWPVVRARYVALVGLARGTDWGYSVWEFTPQRASSARE